MDLSVEIRVHPWRFYWVLATGHWPLMYLELHARSAFSFLEGASLPEALIAVCAEYGMPGMALLDRNGVYGAPRFHMAAQKYKLRAHIGAEVTIDDTLFGKAGLARYPLLAESRTG